MEAVAEKSEGSAGRRCMAAGIVENPLYLYWLHDVIDPIIS
jgi:hypothetical protein